MFINFKERGREKEREKHQCERLTWTGCLLFSPDWELNPQPKYVPQLGIKPPTIWYMG